MAGYLDPSAGSTDDAELIERTIAGDDDAFSALVERYQQKIYRVAFAIVRDEMEADVVTQDTFVKAYYRLRDFEGRSELETWLTRIAINRSRDSLRTNRRWVPFAQSADDDNVLPMDPADERPDAEREVASTQMAEAIGRAIDKLSGQQKTVFCLRHYENLPLEEIAGMLGLKSGTVRAHLFRAVHKVRAELEEWQQSPFLGKGVVR